MTATYPGTALTRTVDLLQAVDLEAKALACKDPGPDHFCDCQTALALRHVVECLSRIVQTHPTTAEFAETFAARAAEALLIVEAEG